MKSILIAITFLFFASETHAQYNEVFSSNYNEVLLHNGDKGLKDVVVADINKDGNNDLVLSNFLTHTIYWLEYISYGEYVMHVLSEMTLDPSFIAVEDIDGDGDLDVLYSDKNKLGYFLQLENAQFKEVVISDVYGDCWNFNCLDYDHDGDKDVLVISRIQNALLWFENERLDFTPHLIAENLVMPQNMDVGDVDANGEVDVIVTSKQQKDLTVYLKKGEEYVDLVVCESAFANRVKLSDLNKDGLLDIICSPADTSDFHLHFNKGNLAFQTKILHRDNKQSVTNIETMDVDRNGTIDVLFNDCEGNHTMLLLQGDEGDFEQSIVLDAQDPHGMYLEDYDSDGDTDIVVSAIFDGKVICLENNFRSEFSFNKLYFQISNYRYIKHALFALFVVLFLLLVRFLSRTYTLSLSLKRKDLQLDKLKQKSISQELINLSHEKVIDELREESKLKKIKPARWTSFLREYRDINPELCEKLNAYKLTKSEFRLAIFIASELNAHEIAEILAVNINTVYVQRQRLKDKLSLKSANDIEEFLRGL